MRTWMMKYFMLLILSLSILPLQSTKSAIIKSEPRTQEFNVTATCYNADPGQTDNFPLITADGSKIDENNPLKHRWIGVSRDLLKHTKFGDVVFITGTGIYDGYWHVRDVMNKRFKKRIDFLVGKKNATGKWNNITIIITKQN